MLTELRKIIDRNADHCNKELETTKMKQSKIDNSISKTKSNLEVMNSQINDIKEQISGEFLGGAVVRTRHFHCHGPWGSIPGRGSKILQAKWCGQKQKNKQTNK